MNQGYGGFSVFSKRRWVKATCCPFAKGFGVKRRRRRAGQRRNQSENKKLIVADGRLRATARDAPPVLSLDFRGAQPPPTSPAEVPGYGSPTRLATGNSDVRPSKIPKETDMRAIVFTVLVTFASQLFGADATKQLLDAPRVDDYLQLTSTKNKKGELEVSYRIDGSTGHFEPLTDGDTFASPRSAEIGYFEFNPFKRSISAKETSADDPNAKAIADFFTALQGFAKTVAPSETGGGPNVTAPLRTQKTPQACAEFVSALENLQIELDKLREAPVTKKDFDDWVDKATGLPGIEDVRKRIDTKRGAVATLITEAEDAKNKAAALQKNASAASCANVGVHALLFSTAADVNSLIRAYAEVRAALEGLVKMLDSYIAPKAPMRWRDGGPGKTNSDLVVTKVVTSPDLTKTVAVTIKHLNPAFDPDAGVNAITFATDVETTPSVVFRRYRRWVPEVGVAAVYNDLRYPKYTTKEVDGKLLVKPDGNESSNVNAAITLNLLCECGTGGFLYPGFQLGVSKVKDYPGLLAGIVGRFAQPKQLAIGTGVMVTWYKGLDTLGVDSEVKSPNDLKADLKLKRSAPAWYLAVQYTF